MKIRIFQIPASLLMLALPAAVSAQNVENTHSYHPFMTDKFNLGIGAYNARNGVEIRVDGAGPGDDIDASSSDLQGHIETSQSGPRLSLTASW